MSDLTEAQIEFIIYNKGFQEGRQSKLKEEQEKVRRLKRKAKKGWEGYIGVVHIDDIIKIFGSELAGVNHSQTGGARPEVVKPSKSGTRKGCGKEIPAGFDRDRGYPLYNTCGLTICGETDLCPECSKELAGGEE